jgi:aldehyde dehydrogenase (NAD+)
MMKFQSILKANGLTKLSEGDIEVRTPIDGSVLGSVKSQKASSVDGIVKKSVSSFNQWKSVPAPVRGELIRLLGDELRTAKKELGALVSLESGKIISEGQGEVQEMIDICDFAVGQSRQLYGLTIASERPGHHMREVWHPLGPVGIITAFNFPVAVWAWNAALALVCGDSVIWKPSEKTPLSALACEKIFERALKRFKAAGNTCPNNLLQVVIGDADIGKALAEHKDIPLISATGSTCMGSAVAQSVSARLGKTLLELGGNNAMIVTPSADLDMAVRAILFGAVGTAGQRCTSLRRLIVHKSVKEKLLKQLKKAYESVSIGNPLNEGILNGPLIDEDSFDAMQNSLASAKKEGGKILTGGDRKAIKGLTGGYYVTPAIVEMKSQDGIVRHETFAPILYVLTYNDFEEAIAINNDVPQGLSSCIFTLNVREAEQFLSSVGSDCGIANVNIGPSGAEIGGAFGGEKDTGGGRESGSDSWKAYMRRQTQTVNYTSDLPLAQGVVFEI